jgi:hypothetical protein
VVFEMLTGEVPFGGTSPVGIAMRHVADEVPPPSSLNAEVPPRLDEIVATATAKDPERRYPSAAHMAEALRDATGPIPAPAPVTVPSNAAGAGPTQVLADTPHPNEGPSPGLRRALRGVTVALGLLALAVVALLGFRLIAADDPRGSAAGGGGPRQGPAAAGRPADTPAAQPSETPAAPELVTVPQLIGLDYKDAVAELEAVGLEPSKKVDRTSTEAKDVVVAMSPDPGTELEPAASVTVVVSKGVPPGHEDEEGEGD